MRLSSLSRLISGEMDASEFAVEIREEFTEHSKGLKKTGGIARVAITEDHEFTLDRPGISALCRLYLAEKITAAELAYITDVMQLSDGVEFSDARVVDDVALLTDPEINGAMTTQRALRIANALPT